MKRISIIALVALLGLFAAGSLEAAAQSYSDLGKKTYDYSVFRIGIQGGWGYRVYTLSPDLPDYEVSNQNKLKSGIAFGADATWFFSKDMGLGLRYHTMFSSNTITLPSSDAISTIQRQKEDVELTYLAPQLSTRYLFLDRHSVTIDISVGYLTYRDYKDYFLRESDYRVNGSTLGYAGNVGYDFAISPRFAVGASCNIVIGTLKKIKLGGHGKYDEVPLDKEDYISLNHLTLTAGLRFTL